MNTNILIAILFLFTFSSCVNDSKNKSVISELIVGERFEAKFTLIKNSKKHKKI